MHIILDLIRLLEYVKYQLIIKSIFIENNPFCYFLKNKLLTASNEASRALESKIQNGASSDSEVVHFFSQVGCPE